MKKEKKENLCQCPQCGRAFPVLPKKECERLDRFRKIALAKKIRLVCANHQESGLFFKDWVKDYKPCPQEFWYYPREGRIVARRKRGKP